MPTWLRFLRRCRSVLWTAFFLVTVGLAIVVGLGRALVPYAPKLQPWLEQRLSEELGQAVAMESLEAKWQGLNPYLELHNLRLSRAAGDDAQFDHVRLRLHMLHWLLPRRDDWSLELNGVDLTLRRLAHGDWEVSGFSGGGGDDPDYHALLELGDVTISESRLHVVGAQAEKNVLIDEVMLRQTEQGLLLEGRLGLAQSAPIRLVARLEEGDDNAALEVYLEAHDQPLATWLTLFDSQWRPDTHQLAAAATADITLWLDWFGQTQGELTAELRLHQPPPAPVQRATALDTADAVAANLWLDWNAAGWSLTLADLARVQSTLDLFSQRDEPAGWVRVERGDKTTIRGGDLDLALLAGISIWWPDYPAALAQRQLSGRMTEVSLATDENGQWHQASLNFNNLSLPAQAGQPGFETLGGALNYAAGHGELLLHSGQLVVPEVFPNPLPVQRLNARFEAARRAGAGWSFRIPQMTWDTGAFQLWADAYYSPPQAPEGAPWLALNVAIPRLDIDATKAFLPLGIMGQRTGAWLQSGLKRGHLQDIRATLRGRLDDWPFTAQQGIFRASAQVVDTDIAFNPEWPLVRELNGELRFTPKTMDIDDARVRFGGATIQRLQAHIDDMDDAVLELDVLSGQDAARHLQMLGQLPLRAGAWVEHTDLTLSGPSEIEARIDVDFRDGRSDTSIRGATRFKGVAANYNSRLKLTALRGGFTFDNDGLQPAVLDVQWRQQPAQLRFDAEPFSVGLSGHFDIQQVLDIAGVNDLWQRYMHGTSLWHWHFTPASEGSFLQAQSDLVGVMVDLPDPLFKLPPNPRRLQITMPFGEPLLVQVNYARDVEAMVSLDEQSQVNGVDLLMRRGCSQIPQGCSQRAAPPIPGVGWLGGGGAVADVMGWVDVIETLAAQQSDAGEDDLVWRSDARYQRLQLLGRYFSDARMAFEQQGEHWNVALSGEELLGKIRLPAGDSASNTVVAEFERLYLPPLPQTAAAAGYIDPQAMPTLHLYAEDMRWDDWPVGQIQVQAFPVASGLRFETIEASNAVFTLSGQGEWLRGENGVVSQLDLRVDAEQLGSLLDTLGYGAVVEGGQTSIELNGHWPGGPSDFALARLHGRLDVNVVQGRFTEAGPGAGRMLGLMSVQALPRRILLDFRDVFETGLNFDRLQGEFQLADGFAVTQGLEINSTAAKIVISGRTDLVKREYDQHVSIRPGVGSTLPVIGAIAGGPVGATAGLALQGLLQKPLGGLTEVTYHVVGPWDDPQVKDAAEGAARQDQTLPKLPTTEGNSHKAD